MTLYAHLRFDIVYQPIKLLLTPGQLFLLLGSFLILT